ncbi:MAG: CotH kinase family protein, partial [Acidobacteriaceae bacterium]
MLAAVSGYSQTFTVSASPSSLTIYPGEQNVPVAVTVNSGDNDSDNYTGPVVVTMTGLPSGITVTPVTLTPGSSGTLTLNASPSAGQEQVPIHAASPSTAWTTTASLVGASGVVQVSSPFSLTVSISNPSFAPAQNDINLPIVTIDTSNVPVTSKSTDVPGTITITSSDGQTSYLPNSSDTDNTATFQVHGNSTSQMPKLAYKVKLNTSLDLLNTMGVNCGYVTSSGKATCDKSKSYILLANYDDKTLLRDWAASALANDIPYGGDYLSETPVPSGYAGTIPTPSGTSALMPWAPHSMFVELYLNGVYEGNYQLIENKNVDSHRVNITEMTDSDTSGDALTGGYFLEIDQENGEDFMFETPQGVDIGLVDPDFSPEVPEQTGYITNYVDNAETALFSKDFTDPTLGWRAYFDEASAINFYIVNDVMGNADGGAFFSSDYLYKDQNNPFLYMGPVWDFDISSGNVNYAPIVNPTVPWMQTSAPWYTQWFKDPGFKADVIKQWNALKDNGVFTDWLASIEAQANALEQSQANNNGRWPMQGIEVWPNTEAAGSYDGEVSYLTSWLNLRIAYLDSVFNNKAATTTTLTAPGGTLRNGTQATFSAQVTEGSSPTGSVSFLANGILLGTAPLSGTSASLTTSELPVGNASLEAVYSGDDKNALSASNPQAATVAGPLIATATSLTAASSSFNSSTPTDFTVSVLGDSWAAIPTGAVTLMSGTTSLGSA